MPGSFLFFFLCSFLSLACHIHPKFIFPFPLSAFLLLIFTLLYYSLLFYAYTLSHLWAVFPPLFLICLSASCLLKLINALPFPSLFFLCRQVLACIVVSLMTFFSEIPCFLTSPLETVSAPFLEIHATFPHFFPLCFSSLTGFFSALSASPSILKTGCCSALHGFRCPSISICK